MPPKITHIMFFKSGRLVRQLLVQLLAQYMAAFGLGSFTVAATRTCIWSWCAVCNMHEVGIIFRHVTAFAACNGKQGLIDTRPNKWFRSYWALRKADP